MEEICGEQKLDSQNTCSANATKVLLVAANVGSLFEDPNRLLQPWINEFVSKISQLRPEFIAIHLQEVGGKTYEKSMECVQQFIKNLCEADDLRKYTCIQIFMDEDFRSAEHFTALGNLYFTHEGLSEVKIWNFLTRTWEVSHGKNIFSGNIETIATKEKSKFPQHFFPECKWSRKGFMRTRWDINGTVLDLVNIHLFHDASNLAACEEFPSVYCKTRRRALVHTLERFHLDNKNGLVPFFIFGDFNFRCDAEGVIKELTENLTAHRVHSTKHDSTKVLYRNSEGNNVLTLGKKEFLHADHQLKFKETWLKKHDREIEPLQNILFEYPIEFSPTYPYEEDPEMPTDYMSTRCPAWCDRILMSLTAKEIVEDDSGGGIKENPYNIIGENVCMGDHKPIYLLFKLKPNQGTNRSCKCYSNSGAKANKSASHIKLASIERANGNDFDIHCPYRSHIYNDILIECSKLNELPFNPCKNTNDEHSYAQLLKEHNELPLPNHSSQIIGPVLKELNHPTVSINIYDSDNINVCLCSQMSEINSDLDDIDGTLCQHCLNIIKKQPQRHRCTLISKRLVLSNDIIVNRIDSQYLNTHLDYTKEQHDPYTPESTESHSPYPEFNSVSTTSSNNHTNLDRHSDITKHHLRDISPEKVQVRSNDSPPLKGQNFQDNVLDSDEIRQRGMVTPGQLKSRLEDLQRSSLNNLNNANCGDDVDNVDKFQTKTSFKKHKKLCCLSGCCNIC